MSISCNNNNNEKEEVKYSQLRDWASKPLVILLHGYPTFSYDYKSLYDVLNQDYHVVAADFLGFGFSDKPNNIDYKLMYQADIIDKIIHSRELMASQ